jgi:DnaK suppressor protein
VVGDYSLGVGPPGRPVAISTPWKKEVYEMATVKMKLYKSMLNHRIEEILKTNGKSLFPSEDLNGLLPDMYDLASFETERLYEYALKDRERRTIVELFGALKRIDEGIYGICDDCGKPISEKRLRAAPEATLCIECKATAEKRERQEKINRAHAQHGIRLSELPGGH